MVKPEHAVINLRCEPQLLELIKKQAADEDRTVSSLLRIAVREYITGRQACVSPQVAR